MFKQKLNKEFIGPRLNLNHCQVYATEFTGTCEKSLSILFQTNFLNEQQRTDISNALTENTIELADHIRKIVKVRTFENGKRYWVEPDEILYFTAQHQTSREGDPHLHNHLQISNRARVGDKWYAIDTRQMNSVGKEIRAKWDSLMANNEKIIKAVNSAGFTYQNGKVKELAEDGKMMEKFSQRQKQIKTNLQELLNEKNLGDYTDKKHQTIEGKIVYDRDIKTIKNEKLKRELKLKAYYTGRKRKEIYVDEKEIEKYRNNITQTIKEFVINLPRKNFLGKYKTNKKINKISDWFTDEKIKGIGIEAIANITKNEDYFNLSDVKAEVSKLLDNQLKENQVYNQDIKNEMIGRAIFLLEMTPFLKSIAKEKNISNIKLLEDRGIKQYTSKTILNREKEIKNNILNLRMSGTLKLKLGYAGSGKSYDIVKRVRNGEKIKVLAYQNKVVEMFKNENIPAQTIASFSKTWEQQIDSLDTIIIDEASMTNREDFNHLMRIARYKNKNLEFWGDDKQLQAIERGGIIGTLKKYIEPDYKQETYRFTKEYGIFSRRLHDGLVSENDVIKMATGGVKCLPGESANKAFADELYESIKNIKTDNNITLGIVRSNADVDDINKIIENRLIDEKVLNKKKVIGKLSYEKESDEKPGKIIKHTDLTEAHIGSIIQIKANNKEYGIFNGEKYQIIGRAAKDMIKLSPINSDKKSEKLVKANYLKHNSTLGYSNTIYSAQGMTVKNSLTMIDEFTNSNELYVSLTRGKEQNKLFIKASGTEYSPNWYVKNSLEQFAKYDYDLDSKLAEIKTFSLNEAKAEQMEREQKYYNKTLDLLNFNINNIKNWQFFPATKQACIYDESIRDWRSQIEITNPEIAEKLKILQTQTKLFK